MKNFKDMRIWQKLTLGFGLTIAVFLVGIILIFRLITQMCSGMDRLEFINNEIERFLEVEIAHYKWVSTVQGYALSKESGKLEVEADGHKCSLGAYLYNGEAEKNLKNYPEIIELIESMKETHLLLHATAEKIETLKNSSKTIEAEKILNEETLIYVAKIKGTLVEIRKELKTAAVKISDEKNNFTKKLFSVAFIIVGIALLTGVVITTYTSRIISKNLNKILKASEKLATGDIEINIDINTKDETGILAEAFRKMIEGIKEQVKIIEKMADGDMTIDMIVKSDKDIMNKKIKQMLSINNKVFGEILNAANQVNSAAGQVSQGSTMLAQASAEQASTVEEITSTVRAIASQSKENANSARNANELTDEVRVSVETGSNQMRNMMSSMEEINEASKNISKIIRVIDDIAFQTNILALNAAVEAARAGSHGKGFAVVAEEVRNLAARSAKAANETTDLIESTISKVNTGTKIASETALALNLINERIGKVSLMISDMAASSGEQATAVAQVSLGMSQISEAVQTNSSTAEESAAASEELSAQAMLLKESVVRFKLKDDLHNHNFDDSLAKTANGIQNNYAEKESFGKY